MNSSFYSMLLATLSGADYVPGLPNDALIVFNRDGQLVLGSVSEQSMLKIARLQTLSHQAYTRGALPDEKESAAVAEVTGSMTMFVMADTLQLAEDMTHRCMMLERLIVEIVREEIIAEQKRFDVLYYIGGGNQLMCRPLPERRFLD